MRLVDDAHDRLERRGFADAIAAEQSHDLAGANLEIDAVQDVRLAVPGLQVLHGKERGRRSGMAGPEIGLAHGRIGRDRCVIALREHPAAGEHGDAVAQVGDDAQIVLDHQHGAVRGRRADQRADALDILVAHAGGRLVEQQQFRTERQRRRELERAFAAVRQFGRQRAADKARARRRRSAPPPDRRARASTRFERQKSNECPRRRCKAIRTFSSTVRCGNTAEIWNERPSPSRATSAGRSAVMSWPAKKMRPRVGDKNLVSRLKQVVLPAPFGSDQRVDAAAPNAQIDRTHGQETGEFLGQILSYQNRIVGHRFLPGDSFGGFGTGVKGTNAHSPWGAAFCARAAFPISTREMARRKRKPSPILYPSRSRGCRAATTEQGHEN